jgi:hypothetical protein
MEKWKGSGHYIKFAAVRCRAASRAGRTLQSSRYFLIFLYGNHPLQLRQISDGTIYSVDINILKELLKIYRSGVEIYYTIPAGYRYIREISL